MDQLLTIDILGQPFTFKTDSDVMESRAVADFVAKTVRKIHSQCAQDVPTTDKRAVLILAALNITSEYFDLKKRHKELLQVINQRSVHLLNALESQAELYDAKITAR